MHSKQKLTLAIVIVAVAVIVGINIFAGRAPKFVDSIAARTKGDPQAKVQIIEFIDFECPACANGSKILREYTAKYPQGIRLQIKYFPLVSHHRHAMQSALYSECAGRQGKFRDFHDLLMAQQGQWSSLINADASFMQIAGQAGLDKAQLNACIASDDVAKMINGERSLGQSLGIQSTPTYFVNNKMVVGTKSLMDELNTYFPQ